MSNIDKNDQSNLARDLFAISLDPHPDTALQVQLISALRRIILGSPHHIGTRLPASRMLAAELSVSRTTVQAVYDQLISEGYLTAHQGSGTFVAAELPHINTPARVPVTSPRKALPWPPFQTGLPDTALVPYQIWARHLERAWRLPAPALIAQPDPLGWYPLRQAIAEHLSAWRQLNCAPEQIVITSGARESLGIILHALLEPSRPVAIEDPCWPKTRDLLNRAGHPAQPLPIDEHGFDPTQVLSDTGAVIVTPSRHYPSGRSLPLARRLQLIDWAKHTGGLIIEDDYDSEFHYRGHPLPALSGLDGLQNTLYLGSFSKLISSSIRLGYMVIPQNRLTEMKQYLRNSGTDASLIVQPALATFMDSGDFAIHLRRMRRIYSQRQKHLLRQLSPIEDLLEVKPDPAGMHLCLPLKPTLRARTSDREISTLAQADGLSIGALSNHSVYTNSPQALLLGYSAFEEDCLSDACERLCNLLRHIMQR